MNEINNKISSTSSSKLSLRKRRREKNKLNRKKNKGSENGTSSTSTSTSRSSSYDSSKQSQRKRQRVQIPLPNFSLFFEDDDDSGNEQSEKENVNEVSVNNRCSKNMKQSNDFVLSKNLDSTEDDNLNDDANPNSNSNFGTFEKKLSHATNSSEYKKQDFKNETKRDSNSNELGKELKSIIGENNKFGVVAKCERMEKQSNENPPQNPDVSLLDKNTTNGTNSQIDDQNINLKNTEQAVKTTTQTDHKDGDGDEDDGDIKFLKCEMVHKPKSSPKSSTELTPINSQTSIQANEIIKNSNYKTSKEAITETDITIPTSTPPESNNKNNNNQKIVGLSSISPNLNDFAISSAQKLANAEKKLERDHEDLLQKSNYHTMNKKSRPRIRTRTNQSSSTSRLKMTPTDNEKCVLCSTCSCSRTHGILKSLEDTAVNEDRNPLSHRAKSDTEIERALIGRLGRLEKSASYFNHLCTKVSRELKKHRNKIIKARAATSKRNAEVRGDEGGGRPQFLYDVHEETVFQQNSLRSSTKLSITLSEKATRKTYAFRKKCQPTLTQMLGDDDDDEEPDNEPDRYENTSIDNMQITETNTLQNQIISSNKGDDTLATKSLNNEWEETSMILLSDEENSSTLQSEPENENETFVEYEMASSRGKARGLWGLSSVTKQQFNECVVSSSSSFMDNNHDYEDIDILMSQNDGMEFLVNMMNDTFDDVGVDMDMEMDVDVEKKEKQINSTCTTINEIDRVSFSQLSPKNKEAYKSIKKRILQDVEKTKIIQSECPNWDENILFALHQQCPTDTQHALDNVKKKRCRIQKLIDVWIVLQHKDSVLELFELVLLQSLSNFDQGALEGCDNSDDSGDEL